ncbi:hypothetical protein AB837_00374 [bacterium AB1]|nr:hypothetical protein AB837_00374 [bacterium AB1]
MIALYIIKTCCFCIKNFKKKNKLKNYIFIDKDIGLNFIFKLDMNYFIFYTHNHSLDNLIILYLLSLYKKVFFLNINNCNSALHNALDNVYHRNKIYDNILFVNYDVLKEDNFLKHCFKILDIIGIQRSTKIFYNNCSIHIKDKVVFIYLFIKLDINAIYNTFSKCEYIVFIYQENTIFENYFQVINV